MATKKKNAAKKAKKKKTGRPRGSCFVIMPFGGFYDEYYQNVYCAAVRKGGFAPVRADDIYMPGTIVNDIYRLTKESKVVLADLSTKNPNVFYELGLAHSMKKPVVLVTDNFADIPFDLRSRRVIQYDKQQWNWAATLEAAIVKALTEVKRNPDAAIIKFDGHEDEEDDEQDNEPTSSIPVSWNRSSSTLSGSYGSSFSEALSLAMTMKQSGYTQKRIYDNLRMSGFSASIADTVIRNLY